MATTHATNRFGTNNIRPACLDVLGVATPCTMTDVKVAYRAKVRAAHPDTGGSHDRFIRLEKAFHEALDYVARRSPRWKSPMDAKEACSQQRDLIAELKRCGATVKMQEIEPLACQAGDFSVATERIVHIRLCGSKVTDAVVDLLVRYRNVLGSLRRLDLAFSKITDRGLRKLFVLPSLTHLDLTGTTVTWRGLKVLDQLPDLRVADLTDTHVGWMIRTRLRWSYPGLQLACPRNQPRFEGMSPKTSA